MRKLMLAIYLLAAITIVKAQQLDTKFEVASVKRNTSASGNGMMRLLPGGRVSAENFPVRLLITYAYQLANFQVAGGPGWLMSDGYDVIAKIDGNPTPGVPGTGEFD